MRNSMVAAGIAIALGGLSGMAAAQVKPDVLVKQRQAVMTLQGKYIGPIAGMATGKVPYNADAVSRNATYLENLSQMAWDGFQESTKGEKTADLLAFLQALSVAVQMGVVVGEVAGRVLEIDRQPARGAPEQLGDPRILDGANRRSLRGHDVDRLVSPETGCPTLVKGVAQLIP